MAGAISSQDIELEIVGLLERLGLYPSGWFVMADAPFTGRAALLIGNHADDGEHKMWQVFSNAPEYGDGLADPLNRWTKRVMEPVATAQGAVALYPFGEPIWPFQKYARQAGGMKPSPLGILIHAEFGLWHAFRAVLVFGKKVQLSLGEGFPHPCDACEDKPCLSACPVSAFSDNGFAVDSCRTHLKSGGDPDCMSVGCRARAACPIGTPYSEEQVRFHMKSFGEM